MAEGVGRNKVTQVSPSPRGPLYGLAVFDSTCDSLQCSRTTRKYSSVILSHPVYDTWLHPL